MAVGSVDLGSVARLGSLAGTEAGWQGSVDWDRWTESGIDGLGSVDLGSVDWTGIGRLRLVGRERWTVAGWQGLVDWA